MKRFCTYGEPMPHEFTQAEILSMSDRELVDAINASGSWDADLLADLIFRAFPDFAEPWEVGDPICYDAAEALGFELD